MSKVETKLQVYHCKLLNEGFQFNYSKLFTWQAHNALFIVRCIAKLLMQDFAEDDVIDILQFTSGIINSSLKYEVLVYSRIKFELSG